MRKLLLFLMGGVLLLALSKVLGLFPTGDERPPDFEAKERVKRALEGRPQSSSSSPFDRPKIVAKDPLTNGLSRVIEDVALGKLGPADQRRLTDRVEELLEDEMFGTMAGREAASESTVKHILFNAARHQPGVTTESLTPLQRQAIHGVAGDLAARLRLRFFLGKGESTHTGQTPKTPSFPPLPEGYRAASWQVLGGFTYVQGGDLPQEVRDLDQQPVGVFGFMLPLEGMNYSSQFLVVESRWTCCFGAPPALNHGVLVSAQNHPVPYTLEPVLILGKLSVGEVEEDGFVTSLYRQNVIEVRRTSGQ